VRLRGSQHGKILHGMRQTASGKSSLPQMRLGTRRRNPNAEVLPGMRREVLRVGLEENFTKIMNIIFGGGTHECCKNNYKSYDRRIT